MLNKLNVRYNLLDAQVAHDKPMPEGKELTDDDLLNHSVEVLLTCFEDEHKKQLQLEAQRLKQEEEAKNRELLIQTQKLEKQKELRVCFSKCSHKID